MLKRVLIAAILLMNFSFIAQAEVPSAEIAAKVIAVKSPEVNAVTPIRGNAQIFMELDNNGVAAHKLIAAYSPVAKRIQLHQTIQNAGKLSMQQVPMIVINPHQEQGLQQGGFHIMLMDLDKSLKKGHQIPVILLFEDGSYLNLSVTIV